MTSWNEPREMTAAGWERVRSIFEERGVSREVAEARPYIPYERGDEWVTADDGPFAAIPPEQRNATILRDVRGADGLVMVKHPVPLKDSKLAEFPPQLRPTKDPHTGSIVNHNHDDRWIAATARRRHVRDHHGGDDATGLHDNFRLEMHNHNEYSRQARKEHVAGRAHHRVDTEADHPNGEPGKYKLPPTPLTDEASFHVHPLSAKGCRHRPTCTNDAEHTAKHIHKAREHRGAVSPGEPHVHRYRVPDRHASSYGKRLDIHPLGVKLLKDAEVVFISMEGNLKADAILTHILRHNRPWAVVDIPSVGQWRAPELDEFAAEHLAGRRVFLVCDSDWAHPSKFDVQRQAFAFREYLRRELRAKHAIQVASPPEPADRDEWGEPLKVGVDDLLADREHGGYGGSLEQLLVVEREIAPAMRHWTETYVGLYGKSGANPYVADARIVSLMSLIAKSSGEGRGSVSSIASFTSMSRHTVHRVLSEWNLENLDVMPESPLEWLERRTGYGRTARELKKLAGGDMPEDTVEWCIRDGYRWWEAPRRTVADILI